MKFSFIAPLFFSFVTLISTGIFLPALACADDSTQPLVRKLDPRDRSFVPVMPAEVIPGKIYNHYDHQHDRYVWAFALAGGKFSYPLGPGTTENPSNFDLVTSESQTQDLVESAAGDWAKLSAVEGHKLLVRMQASGEWEVLRAKSVRSHFDSHTGRRWQWSGQRKVAIKHARGSAWRYEGNWYVPADSGLNSAHIHIVQYGCAYCER